MPKPWILEDAKPHGLRKLHKHIVGLFTLTLILGWIFLAEGTCNSRRYTPSSPQIARLIQLLLFGLPTLAGVLMALDPVRYRLRPGEIVFSNSSYLSAFPQGWWHFAPLLPGIVLSALVGWDRLTGHTIVPGVSVSYAWALGALSLTTVLACLHAATLFGPSESRLDDEGVRCGLGRFMAWDKVECVDITARRIAIYHRDWPGTPMRQAERNSPETEAALLPLLQRHQIPVTAEGVTPRERHIRSLYIATFLALAFLSAYAWRHHWLADVWLASATTLAGISTCALLDLTRNFHRLTKVRPRTMSTTDAEAEAAGWDTTAPTPDANL